MSTLHIALALTWLVITVTAKMQSGTLVAYQLGFGFGGLTMLGAVMLGSYIQHRRG